MHMSGSQYQSGSQGSASRKTVSTAPLPASESAPNETTSAVGPESAAEVLESEATVSPLPVESNVVSEGADADSSLFLSFLQGAQELIARFGIDENGDDAAAAAEVGAENKAGTLYAVMLLRSKSESAETEVS